MLSFAVVLCLFAQPKNEAQAEPAPAAIEGLQRIYRQDAEKYIFETGDKSLRH